MSSSFPYFFSSGLCISQPWLSYISSSNLTLSLHNSQQNKSWAVSWSILRKPSGPTTVNLMGFHGSSHVAFSREEGEDSVVKKKKKMRGFFPRWPHIKAGFLEAQPGQPYQPTLRKVHVWLNALLLPFWNSYTVWTRGSTFSFALGPYKVYSQSWQKKILLNRAPIQLSR